MSCFVLVGPRVEVSIFRSFCDEGSASVWGDRTGGSFSETATFGRAGARWANPTDEPKARPRARALGTHTRASGEEEILFYLFILRTTLYLIYVLQI
jgi:hypothetical protein